MKRFTILSLMAMILALAVGLAGIRGANEYWAASFLMACPTLFLVALIGALCGSEQKRASRRGFAILGGGYFALAFLGLSEANLQRLPTSLLLAFVEERVNSTLTFTVSLSAPTTSATTAAPVAISASSISSPAPMTLTVNGMTGKAPTAITSTYFAVSSAPNPPPNGWKSFLPGAANREAFSVVGHCEFALLFGVVGALLARRFEKRDRADLELTEVNS